MKMRITRKNKKRRDPRYFLYEDVITDQNPEEAEAPGETETVAVTQEPPVEEPTTTPEEKEDLRNLSSEQLQGAKRMLNFVQEVLGDKHNLAVQDLTRALRTAQPEIGRPDLTFNAEKEQI